MKLKHLTEEMTYDYVQDPSEVQRVRRTHFPASVMVLRAVNNKRQVMSHYVFPEGFRINSAAYIEVLKIRVEPWIDSICKGRLYAFQ